MSKKRKKGKRRYQRLKRVAKRKGVYEDAKDHARSRREDGAAHVATEDLVAVLGSDATTTTSGRTASSSSGTIYNHWTNNLG